MTRFDGADLSHHQDDAGPIDWAALRSVSWWCATKATQGLAYVDPTFAAHWAQMRAHRFTHRLAYGWLVANVDPVAQARHFLDVVGPLGAGEGAMCDAEERGITAAGVLAWCETVEAVTRRPVSVYTGAYVAGGTIWQSTAMRTSKFGRRPMHLAAYSSEVKALALPGVKAYPWSAWQYSSDGPVLGVTGRCDMNRVDRVDHYDVACNVAPVSSSIPSEVDVALITNSEPHQLEPAGPVYPAGVVKWERGVTKRHIASEEEWHAIYGIDPGKALSNAALALIPDHGAIVAQAPPIDLLTLANYVAALVPKRLQGSIEITAAS